MKFSIETETWYETVLILVILSSLVIGLQYYKAKLDVKDLIEDIEIINEAENNYKNIDKISKKIISSNIDNVGDG